MKDTLLFDLNISPEIEDHLPKHLQIMLEVERQAQKEYHLIMDDIRSGKTTLDDVKYRRGLL